MTNKSKKLTQLSAIIAAIFAEGLKKDPNFSITGYDLTLLLSTMQTKFSHQQIYREMKTITFLDYKEVPQEGRPNKKEYSVNIDAAEYLNTLHLLIDFNPKKTHTNNLLAFHHLPILVSALQAHLEKMETTEMEHIKAKNQKTILSEKLCLNGEHQVTITEATDNMIKELFLEKIAEQVFFDGVDGLPADIVEAVDDLKSKYSNYFR